MALPTYLQAIIAAATALASVLAWSDEAPDCQMQLRPGAEIRIPSDGYRGYQVVRFPRDFDPDRTWPIVFHYHAYSDDAAPNVRILGAVTDGTGFVLVGMDYGNRRFYLSLEDRQVKREARRLADTRTALERCFAIDEDRVFLSGYSQGGYAITKIGERMLDDIAGLVVLGAGRGWGAKQMPPRRLIDGKRIFIGAGELDEVHGDRAEGSAYIYAGWGAVVTLERWPGTDHFSGWRWYLEDKDRTAALRTWLLDTRRRRPVDDS